MKVYWRYFLIPFVYGIIFSWYGSFHNSDKLQLWEVVADINGGYLNTINDRTVISIIELFVPFFLYIIVFSTYIYRHFCNSSVYFFSRCEKRIRWYFGEAAKLFGFTCINACLILAGYLFTAVISGSLVVHADQWIIVLWYVSIYTLWSFQVVLLGNILSLLAGSLFGSAAVFTWQIITTLALLTVDCENLTGGNYLRLVWNPNAYLIADWFRVSLRGKQIFGVLEPQGLSLQRGYLLQGVLCIVIILFGAIVVQKVELIENNKGD